MWPEFFIEALEGRLNGFTGGDERHRGALLCSLTAGPRGLCKLAFAALDLGVGYWVVLWLGDAVPLAATSTCEYVPETRFSFAVPDVSYRSSWMMQ